MSNRSNCSDQPATNAVYSCEVVDSIRKLNWDDWNSLRAGNGDLFMDPRFIMAVENSFSRLCHFRYVIFRNARGRATATACLCSYTISSASLAEGLIGRFLIAIEHICPWATSSKLILCGLPISAGQSQIRFLSDANRATVLCQLDGIATKFASEEGARFVIFKEIDSAAFRDMEPLLTLGYLRADSYPMNCAASGDRDFDDYLSHVKYERRRRIRRSRCKFAESGLRLERRSGRDGAAALYTDEVHRLYEAVVRQSKVQFERLPSEFPRELARCLPDNSLFTFVYRQDKIVGFSLSLADANAFHALIVGFDYLLNNVQMPIYFNLLYDALDVALKRGAQEICIGQTTDAVKHKKLGCYQEPLSILLKPAHWSMRPVLRFGFSQLFPRRTVDFPREDVEPFRDGETTGTSNTSQPRPGAPRMA